MTTTKTELLKIAKPILFNTDMVRAILDGRKTVTRRVVKIKDNREIWEPVNNCRNHEYGADISCYLHREVSVDDCSANIIYPKIDSGDYLYVRETWGNWCYDDNKSNAYGYYYKADYPNGARTYKEDQLDDCGEEIICDLPKWHPSIHMPKSAARIFLKVTDVRVERLQDISTRGIRAEGINECFMCCNENCETKTLDRVLCGNTWIDLWNSTIKKQDLDKYSWEANPWVWVYEFERVNEL